MLPSRMPPATIPTALLLLGALLPLLGDRTPRHRAPSPEASVSTPAAMALAARAAGPEASPEATYEAARALGSSLRGTMPAPQRRRLRLRLQALLQGLARRPDAAELPWLSWLRVERRHLPEFSADLLLASRVALGPASVPLAEMVDLVDTPVELRLNAFALLWDYDPTEADSRIRKAVTRDISWRQTEKEQRLADGIVTRVLQPRVDPTSTHLLEDLAARPSFLEHARRLAIRALVQRHATEAAAGLDAIFATEANNVLLRKEALLGLLALRPSRGLESIGRSHPDSRVEPVLFHFLNELRKEHGLPLLAPSR